jgi:methylase of polypeptide subunit release factors
MHHPGSPWPDIQPARGVSLLLPYTVKTFISRLLGKEYISGGLLRPSSKRLDFIRKRIFFGERVLDMGTGTGVLAKMAFDKGAKEVVAVDINPAALAETRKNVPKAIVIESDLFENVEGRFDTIVFAAPWSEGVISKPEHRSIIDDGVLSRFLRDGKKHLAKGGLVWVGYSDASKPNFNRFHKSLAEEGYSVKASWSYPSHDALSKTNASIYLYELALCRE